MQRANVCYVAVTCLIATTMLLAGGQFVRLVADENPPFGDPSKFGTCEDPDPQTGEKCEPETGNCMEYTDGSQFVLGACVTFSAVGWDPVPLPNSTSAKSAKAIEARAYGSCDTAGTADTCQKCGKYWCAKANFWTVDDCPGDVAPVTYAVANEGACDPN